MKRQVGNETIHYPIYNHHLLNDVYTGQGRNYVAGNRV